MCEKLLFYHQALMSTLYTLVEEDYDLRQLKRLEYINLLDNYRPRYAHTYHKLQSR